MRPGFPALSAVILLGLAAPSPAQEMPRRDLSAVRNELQRMVDDGSAVGVVAVVERDGEVLLEAARGELARGEGEMRLDSIFRLYSMTEPVTAVAALTYLEEGRFGLDDPVADYLPELGALRVVDPDDPHSTGPLERPLCVRDLFQHTAGWSHETPWRAVAAGQGNLDPDLGDMVSALAELPLDFQPGAQWRYGISSDVLGALIEAVADRPLNQALADRVFEPLEMVDTDFFVPADKLNRVATLHTAGRDALVPADGRYVTQHERRPTLTEGGTGLFSTAGDYLRFQRMLLNGGELDGVRVLKPETVALMTEDQVGDVPKGSIVFGRDHGLGIAITVGDFDVGSPRSWTWGGAAGTTFWIDPRTRTLAVFLVQNWMDFGPAIRFGAAVSEAFADHPATSHGAPEARDRAGRDVLFYLVDTCRADRTSLHGYERRTTPFLDALAERSVVFERCYSQASWTKPSMAALLTSRYPTEVGIHTLYQRLPNQAFTFPEALREAGWTTAGFSANPIMGAFSNFAQGFDQFTESTEVNQGDWIGFASGSAAKLNAKVFDWLDATDAGPTFLYVHSIDPHEEYEPDPQYLARFADPSWMSAYREQWKALLMTRPNVPGNHVTQWNFDMAEIDPGPFLEHGRNLYDADVLANDAEIERLWNRLAAEGWSEDSIVVVTSDHGEEFFEHGGTSHGYSLYEEAIHVPLLIHAPGILPEGVRIDRPVRSIDLYPTLLDLLDVEAPPGLRGRSLVPLAHDPEEWTDAPVFAESADDPMGRLVGARQGTTTAMIDGDWKLLINFTSPTHRPRPARELFDLRADPGETTNLAGSEAARVARMVQHVEHWSATNLGLRLSADELGPDSVDPALLEELRALGYLAGGADEELPDAAEALPPLVRAVLEADENWNLYALDPETALAEGVDGKDVLRGWHVVGEERVRNEEREHLLRLLYRGFELSDGEVGRRFAPRHAVRALRHGHTVDLVLCLESLQVRVWLDDAMVTTAPLAGDVSMAVKAAFQARGLPMVGDGGG